MKSDRYKTVCQFRGIKSIVLSNCITKSMASMTKIDDTKCLRNPNLHPHGPFFTGYPDRRILDDPFLLCFVLWFVLKLLSCQFKNIVLSIQKYRFVNPTVTLYQIKRVLVKIWNIVSGLTFRSVLVWVVFQLLQRLHQRWQLSILQVDFGHERRMLLHFLAWTRKTNTTFM